MRLLTYGMFDEVTSICPHASMPLSPPYPFASLWFLLTNKEYHDLHMPTRDSCMRSGPSANWGCPLELAPQRPPCSRPAAGARAPAPAGARTPAVAPLPQLVSLVRPPRVMVPRLPCRAPALYWRMGPRFLAELTPCRSSHFLAELTLCRSSHIERLHLDVLDTQSAVLCDGVL